MSSNYYFNGERFIYEDDDGNIHDLDAWSDDKVDKHTKDYIKRVAQPNPVEKEHYDTFVFDAWEDFLSEPTYIDESKKTRYKRITVEYYESLEDGSRVECDSEDAKDIKMEF